MNNTLFVFSWPDISYVFIINKFLEILKPKCLILIMPYKYNQNQLSENYKLDYIHLKQLCIRDNISNYNKNSHSVINIFYKNNLNLEINKIDKSLFLEEYEYSNIFILKDLCNNKLFPIDFFNDFLNNEIIAKLLIDKLIKFKIKKNHLL